MKGTEPLKILYVVTTLDRGGTERQLAELVKGLDRQRFIPSVCCLSVEGPVAAELNQNGVKVKSVPFRGLSLPYNLVEVSRQFGRLVKFIRSEGPDIVHGLLFHAYTLGTFAAKVARVPIVIASRRSLGHFKGSKPHTVIAERIANRMTDLIVANSEAVKKDVVHQENVEPSKVRVIYNGVDPALYDVPADPVFKASLRIPERAMVVGVIANLIHYKGHRFFLQACEEVKGRIPEARFLLIGDGPLRGELERLAKELHLEEEVLFLGTRRDIPQLLSLMDVAVLPSLEEGFPNAVLEAMAAARPVVASRVGGVPEAVIHGETGLLVPPEEPGALAEAILELLDHPNRAITMGQAARLRIEKEFTLGAFLRQTETLYLGTYERKGNRVPGERYG